MKKVLSNPSARRVVQSENGNGHNGHNGHAVRDGVDSGGLKACPTIHDQSRELTSLFVSLTRQLLVVDDFVAELPLRQLRVCVVLYDGPRSMSALSRELGVSLSAMTQIADRLERARLVKRSFEGTDRRVRCLQLTPRGHRIMRLREEARIQRAQSVVERMPESTREQVIQSMRTLLSVTESQLNSDAELASQNGHR
jgi:DNA-binding MarR family transcriptional regulator